MQQNLDCFKLAGLRSGALVKAAAQDSALVAGAIRFDRWRKNAKLHFKRFIMRLRTKAPTISNKLRILVHIRGGIGDVCMTRVFIKKLRETLPDALIYFAYDHKNIVDMVFPDGLIDGFHPNKYIPEEFDLVISGCHLLTYDYINRARFEKLAPDFIAVLEKGLDVQRCFKPFAQYTPYLDGQLAEIAIANGGSRITNLGWFTGLDVKQNDPAPLALDANTTDQTLGRLGLSDQTYITIHDGINPHTDPSHSDRTRNWPRTYWQELITKIKQEFPHLKIVQLGGETSVPFDFVDISLVGKTSIADLPYVLKNACLHIDGESGMVHLANLTQTPCVVLFGPSKAAYLGYARNTNIQAPFCGGCMNISKHWMTQCVLGYPPEKQCLASITPQAVLEAVKNRLS
jgi:ADP-heptose:LPS heptosyltransferase